LTKSPNNFDMRLGKRNTRK